MMAQLSLLQIRVHIEEFIMDPRANPIAIYLGIILLVHFIEPFELCIDAVAEKVESPYIAILDLCIIILKVFKFCMIRFFL